MTDKNALAALFNQLAVSKPVEQESDEERAAREANEDAAYQEILYRRLARLTESASRLDRADLNERSAYMLMWLLEKRKTERIKERTERLTREVHSQELMLQREATREIARKVAKTEIDRRRGAAVKLARDPKQAAKLGALELWKERQAGKHKKLRTVEQFATEVMRRWPVLRSAKVICGWSATWTKQARAGRTPVC